MTLATVGAPWGLQGWVKVWSATSPRERLLEYREFNGASEHWQGHLDVAQIRPQGRFLACKFNGFDSPEAAEKIKSVELQVRRSALPDTEENEYYWHDLIGLQVVTVAGIELGRIEEMLETGANDVMVVQGERRRWVPFVIPEVVAEVDLVAGICRVDWDPDF